MQQFQIEMLTIFTCTAFHIVKKLRTAFEIRELTGWHPPRRQLEFLLAAEAHDVAFL
jgi:hypothetical protein